MSQDGAIDCIKTSKRLPPIIITIIPCLPMTCVPSRDLVLPQESRDVLITSFTLLFHGHQLLVDGELQLNFGR